MAKTADSLTMVSLADVDFLPIVILADADADSLLMIILADTNFSPMVILADAKPLPMAILSDDDSLLGLWVALEYTMFTNFVLQI